LGVEGEGGEVGCYGICDEVSQWGVSWWVVERVGVGGGEEAVRLGRLTFRVELGVQVRVLGLEPFFAFLCGAAEFAVLCEDVQSVAIGLDLFLAGALVELPLGEDCRL